MKGEGKKRNILWIWSAACSVKITCHQLLNSLVKYSNLEIWEMAKIWNSMNGNLSSNCQVQIIHTHLFIFISESVCQSRNAMNRGDRISNTKTTKSEAASGGAPSHKNQGRSMEGEKTMNVCMDSVSIYTELK